MKKTLITLLAVAGVAMADTSEPVWTQTGINLGDDTAYDLSSFGLNTTTGYTLMMEVNLAGVAVNGPLCYVTNTTVDLSSTSSVNAYSYSTGSVGFGNQNNGMITFSAGGGYSNGTNTSDCTKAISYVYDESQAYSTTLFLTSIGGTTELYELTSTGDVIKTHSRSSMGTGDIQQLIVGDWWAGTKEGDQAQQTGTMNVAMYSGVLTLTQMKGLLIPEPTTATLSLLALVGLAARRRRK